MTKTEIGQAIRTRRKALRIYQSELAQRAGVTTATVIEVEKGRNFTANTLLAILDVLGMSIEIKQNEI